MPALPSKAQIAHSFQSHPNWNPEKLFFYATQAGHITADIAAAFAHEHYPGYITLLDSFHPDTYPNKWTIEVDDEEGGEELNKQFIVLASEVFAKLARGTVIALLLPGQGEEKTWSDTSFWNKEWPILKHQASVTKVIRVNVNNNKQAMKG